MSILNKYKKVVVAVLVTIAIVLLYVAMVAAKSVWDGYQWQRSVDKWQEGLRAPYKADTYGGKTPEETWAMFLDALKKNDLELASKYFAVEKQKEWEDGLESIKSQKRLNEVIGEFQTLHQLEKDKSTASQNSDKAYYYITTHTKEFGDIASSVVFYLNSVTGVWKILVL